MQPRIVAVLTFAVVSLGLLSLGHYYLWSRLVRDTQLPSPWRKPLALALIVLGVNLPLGIVLPRWFGGVWVSLWARLVLAWLGTLWLLLAATAALELVRRLLQVAQPKRALDPTRRNALKRLTGIGAAGLGGGAALVALAEAGKITLPEVEVSLPRLPRPFDGLRIAHLSDVHVGPTLQRDFVESLVEQVNARSPDLVVITGDLVDGSVAQLKECVAPLSKLRSRFGTFFVTGNHEYYSGAEEWCQHLPSLGIRVLRNESEPLELDGHRIQVAGVEDFHADRYGSPSELVRALSQRVPNEVVVLLAHQPRSVYEAAALDVDLQLSGHTHGGQLWPFNWLVRLQQPVVAGLERIGSTLVYVSRGTGYWGPPMRLGAPAEIALITLRSSAATA